MVRINFKNWAVDEAGNIVPSAAFEVRDLSNTLVTPLYAGESGATTVPNPGNADSDGVIEFWIDPGDYKITVGSGPSEVSRRFNANALAGRFGDGTAAEPGISFAGDPTTGLFLLANNQLAAVTDGIRRWLLSTTAFQLDVQLTGSAVTQSDIDTTDGRLLKVSDFGIGGRGIEPSTDYDAIEGCMFLGDGITSTPSDKPSFARGHAGVHAAATSDRWMQMLAEVAGGPDRAKLWWRRNYNGTISDWQQIFSQGNILGTVSQSGGTPTGAMIERGSNTNGEYVRFADGTQICTAKVTVDVSAPGAENIFPYPAAFASTPIMGFSAENGSLTPIGGTNSIPRARAFFSSVWAADTDDWIVRVRQSESELAGTIDDYGATLVAFGRWF